MPIGDMILDNVTMPDKPSSDYLAMLDYWQTVDDMNSGTQAMRDGGERYLPKFASEDLDTYKDRRDHAVFTNLHGDIVENLSDRPFAKEVAVLEGSDQIKALCEDIDGQGNNLHNFAATYFHNGVDYGIDWIFVDYTRTEAYIIDASGQPRRKSVLEERQSGARPYWVRVAAREMIAVYSAVINGEEDYVHCRMIERLVMRNGWDEVEVIQVRELNRDPIYNADGNVIGYDDATYRVWQQKDQRIQQGTRYITKKAIWTVIDEGMIAIGVIPIVPLVIGERIGTGWRLKPAMKAVVDKQLEYYEQENGLKNIKTLTAYPMLSASNVAPEKDDAGNIKKAPVGPRAVLYAPPTEVGAGKWEIIEPAATSMTFLRGELTEMEKHLRELGRQPLTQQSSGNMTTIAAASSSTKGNSAIQRWALLCKDALENALYLTALWLNDTVEPTVQVHTDFPLEDAGDDGFDHVAAMRKDGDLSQVTLWAEGKRRKILSDEFDPDKEAKLLEEEQPSDEELDATLVEGQIDPRTGLPFVPKEPGEDETMSPDPEET
jgi:hypothetical protein